MDRQKERAMAEFMGDLWRRFGEVPIKSPLLKAWLRYAGVALLAFIAAPYVLTLVYIFIDPPISAYMLRERLSGVAIHQEWRDLSEISDALKVQVIVSEDSKFCSHSGVDFSAIDEAMSDAEEGGKARGASTLTMQTAKNLFLWNRPSFLRKIFEIPLALYMDLVLGKQRVLELYLNIAQWGPGVFGAEAAARYHYSETAAAITGEQAAELAAALPNPIARDAGQLNPRYHGLVQLLRARALKEGAVAKCVLDRRKSESFEEEEEN